MKRNQAVFLNNAITKSDPTAVRCMRTSRCSVSSVNRTSTPKCRRCASPCVTGGILSRVFPSHPAPAIRPPQVGFRSPVLASDGANLAAAFQTIVEIGDELLLMRILDQAFPAACFTATTPAGASA